MFEDHSDFSVLRGFISIIGAVLLVSGILFCSVSWGSEAPPSSRSQKSAPRLSATTEKISQASKPLPYDKYAKLPYDKHAKYVALTFDDGPSPVYTHRILAILKREHVPATFFVLGNQAKRHRGIVKAEVAQGNQVANHSWNHKNMNTVKNKSIGKDLGNTRKVIRRVTGVDTRYVRLPYGNANKRVRRKVRAMKLIRIYWDKDPRDWSRPGVKKIISRATHGMKNGQIILMHDGGGNRSQTVRALGRVITKLKKQGFTFCTVDDLYRFDLK